MPSQLLENINFLAPEPIRLMDDSDSDDSDNNCKQTHGALLQIKSAHIVGCTTINADRYDDKSSQCKFTVWTIEAEFQTTDTPRVIRLSKRYSDFVDFRELLLAHLPTRLQTAVPKLPPQVKWYNAWRYQDANFNKLWLCQRRDGLNYFLDQVLLNHTVVSHAPAVIQKFLEYNVVQIQTSCPSSSRIYPPTAPTVSRNKPRQRA
ncbi:Ypt35p Ecym_5509 [Eremothecium cymbalariae DBVPG|uniref:Endosomal/vacuolar adapter protein YPT35 n=1 Tax=Eremothecium cymbalariae (strain CBS 270.75 / DBVPG 7215 / KCTC 17166 / NRRL Y-17582) TaxID=931890 RepID=I6NDW0_ERECY|nr:hypothetical protein Ecym_5509 [Eremothecium cymbalariae DBVPG\